MSEVGRSGLKWLEVVWELGLKVIRSRPGPGRGQSRTGPDRTEAIRSGPQSKGMSYSVLGPVPVWTGGLNMKKEILIFFRSPVCGAVVPQPVPEEKHWHGQPVPFHWPGTASLQHRTGPVRSSVHLPPLFGPRSRPVRSGPGPVYSPIENGWSGLKMVEMGWKW